MARRPPPAPRRARCRRSEPVANPRREHCRNQSGNTMSGGAGRRPVPRRVRRLLRARRAEPEGEGEGEGGRRSCVIARRPPPAASDAADRNPRPTPAGEHCRNQSRNEKGPGPTSRVHVVSIFVAAPEASIAAAATAVRAAHSRAGSQADPARRVAARRGAASWAGLGGARETRAVRVAVSSARHAARGGRRRSALEMKSMRGCHRREHCRNQSRNTMAPGPTSRVHVVPIFFAAPGASITAAAKAVRAAHSRSGSQADRARWMATRGGTASWAGLGGAREARAVRLAVSSARHAARGGRCRITSPTSVDAGGSAGDFRWRASGRLSRRRVQRAVQSPSSHRRGWRCRRLDPRDDRPGGSTGASPEPGARSARSVVRRALSRSVAAHADRGPLRPPLRAPQSSPSRRRVGCGARPLLERSLVRRVEDPRATVRGVAARASWRPSTARDRHGLAAHDRLETPRSSRPRRRARRRVAACEAVVVYRREHRATAGRRGSATTDIPDTATHGRGGRGGWRFDAGHLTERVEFGLHERTGMEASRGRIDHRRTLHVESLVGALMVVLTPPRIKRALRGSTAGGRRRRSLGLGGAVQPFQAAMLLRLAWSDAPTRMPS